MPSIRDQLVSPQQRSATMLSRHAQQRSLEIPSVPASRSRTSLNNYASEYSGQDSDSEMDSGSDSDDVLQDLAADNIPVTGFAVASSKRNLDFHELFVEIPEGDYLIEGEHPYHYLLQTLTFCRLWLRPSTRDPHPRPTVHIREPRMLSR